MLNKDEDLTVASDEESQQYALINAIREGRSEQVLEILHKGANPNFFDNKKYPCPLTIAFGLMEGCNSSARTIINLLLEYGADYLNYPYADDEGEWDNILDYVLHQKESYNLIEILLQDSLKKGLLSRITLDGFEINEDTKVLSLLLKYGIQDGAEFALIDALDVSEFYTDKRKRKGFLQNCKLLYEVASKNKTLSLSVADLYLLFSIAVEENDFNFSWNLIENNKSFINSQSVILFQGFQTPLLLVLLSVPIEKCDSYYCAILATLLNKNSARFYQKIKNAINTFNNTNKRKLNLNARTIKLAKSLDTKLYSAMIAFLNPLEKTLDKRLPINVRLRIATHYLNSELGSLLKSLRESQIEKLVLDRAVDYYYVYYPSTLANLIHSKCVLSSHPSILFQEYSEIIKIILYAYIEKNLHIFLSPESRQSIITYIKFSDFSLHKDIMTLEKHLHSIINLWSQKYSHLPDTDNTDFIFYYGLGLCAQEKSDSVLLKIINNNMTHKIHDRNMSFLKIIDFIKSNHFDAYKKYFSNIIETNWLSERLLWHAVRLNSNELVCQLLLLTQPTEDAFIHAVKSNQHIIIISLLSSYKTIRFEVYSAALNIAFLNKNYQIVSMILKNHSITCFPSENIAFYKDFVLQVVRSKQFDIVTMVLLTYSYYINIEYMVSNLLQNQQRFPPYFNSILTYFYDSTIKKLPLKYDIVSQYILMQRNFKYIEEGDKVSIKTFSKLLSVKKSYIEMNKYLAIPRHSLEIKDKRKLFTKLIEHNYQKLIDRLANPTYLPLECYTTIMKQKGFHTTIQGPNILTTEEKELYSSILNMKWKMGHGVKSLKDLDKIKNTGELRSIKLRGSNAEMVENTITPQDFRVDGFIFLTLAPMKAPKPFFLHKSPYIEFDIDRLLEKYPSFFQHAHLSSHWFSFKTAQEYPPYYMGNSFVQTVHDENLQHNLYFQDNQKPILVSNNKFDDLYGGKRIIHILTLLFIDRLRHIGGSFYEEILNNHKDTAIISNSFVTIMHPGCYEIRYPHSIPLNAAYCVINDSPTEKILNEEELLIATRDLDYLTKCINEGFDTSQKSIICVSHKGHTTTYLASFLTRAILNQNKAVIDYLMERGFPYPEMDNPGTLTPCSAAIIMKDYHTAIRLLKVGIPISHLKNVYFLPTYNELLPYFFKKIPTTDVIYLAKRPHTKKILNVLLFSCLNLVQRQVYERHELLDVIKLLIQRSATLNQLNIPIIQESIKTMIKLNWNDLLIQLIDNKVLLKSFINHPSINIIECCLSNSNFDLIDRILLTAKNNNYRIKGKELLLLYASGQIKLFRQLSTELIPDFAKKNDKELLTSIVHSIYLKDHKNIFFIFKYFTERPAWINLFYLQDICKTMFDMNAFKEYIIEFDELDPIEMMLKTLELPNRKMDVINFILDNDFTHKMFLVSDLLDMNVDEIDISETIQLFTGLKSHPILFAIALKKVKTENIFHYVNIDFALSFFLNNYNFVVSRKLYSFFSKQNTLELVLDAFTKKSVNPDLVVEWLLRLVNNDLSLKNLLLYLSIFKSKIAFSAVNHFFNPNVLQKYEIIYQERFKSFIYYLFPEIKKDSRLSTLNFWAHRYKFEAEDNTHLPLELTAFWRKYASDQKTLLNPLNKSTKRSSTASFITYQKNNDLFVYLGKKKVYGCKLNFLLAPGGYFNSNPMKMELLIEGAIREIQEETKFTINIPSNLHQINEELLTNGTVTFRNDNTFQNTPESVSILYNYHSCDNFNSKNEDRERNVYFLWFNFNQDLSTQLTSGDDFAEGMWVPLSEIKCGPDGDYRYKGQTILNSNAMIINHIQSKYISKSLLHETLYKEYFSTAQQIKKLTAMSFLSNESPTMKRPAEKQLQGTFNKRP